MNVSDELVKIICYFSDLQDRERMESAELPEYVLYLMKEYDLTLEEIWPVWDAISGIDRDMCNRFWYFSKKENLEILKEWEPFFDTPWGIMLLIHYIVDLKEKKSD